MSKLPERIKYAADNKNYACLDDTCKARHDAEYIREDLATCTPEERAVIEAARRWLTLQREDISKENEQQQLDNLGRRVQELAQAVDALIKTTSKIVERE